MRRAITLACAAGSASCAAYGWADRPGASVTQAPVAVDTVVIDASSGADPAYLTRALVASLHRSGVVGASWTTTPSPDGTLVCDVAIVDEAAFADALHVSASARCAIDGRTVAERRGDVQLATSANRRLHDRAEAAEAASISALDAVAADIAELLAAKATP